GASDRAVAAIAVITPKVNRLDGSFAFAAPAAARRGRGGAFLSTFKSWQRATSCIDCESFTMSSTPSERSDAMNRLERSSIAEFEQLEIRQLLSATAVRSIDGTGNNKDNPSWGSAGVDLLREGPAAYADGMSMPAGENRPSPREISNSVAAAVLNDEGEGITN